MEVLDYLVSKYNITISRKSPIEIPDMSRTLIARMFADLGYTVGAEIGVLHAKYSRELCLCNPDMILYGIDPWLEYPELTSAGPQYEFDQHYEIAKSNAPPNCDLIRKKSMDALAMFEDNSLDFVYIDGNHEFTSEANDIHEWSKKVKPGGIISGHDYRPYKMKSFSHTYEVVNAYTQAYRIRPWFILGRNVEHVCSWMWVKIKGRYDHKSPTGISED